jgi:mono/diheme cytochrome c family protein
MRWICAFLISLLITGCSQEFDPWHEDAETGRWYNQEQVRQGHILYRHHCVRCHGEQAEGAPNWPVIDSRGFYPPPPLDGSAHTWHHPFKILVLMIKEGRGEMPAWENKLNDDEISKLIAWSQSLWSDEGYRIWQRSHQE